MAEAWLCRSDRQITAIPVLPPLCLHSRLEGELYLKDGKEQADMKQDKAGHEISCNGVYFLDSLTAVYNVQEEYSVMRSSLLWVVTQYLFVVVYRHLGTGCRFHVQGSTSARRILLGHFDP